LVGAESGKRERMAIFNAYYFPGGSPASLDPSITPVNSFRVLFDAYFHGDFGRLPDVSYFSNPSLPYDLSPVAAGP
jgi:hypothetical protein